MSSYTPRHAAGAGTRTAPVEPSQAAAQQREASLRRRASSGGQPVSILWLFIGLMVIMLMSSLNQTVLSPSLPTIVGELNGVEHMSWVITAFILVSTIMMPVYGKLGDLWGRKPLLIFAILAFAAGSLTGAIAQDMNTLILSRALQGLGGGGLMILSQAVIADVIPARDRGKYMGALMGVFAFSSVAGPLLGGWLTEGPGWRWGFWMNLPLAGLALAAAVFLIPHTNSGRQRRDAKVDVLGMALLGAATACLVIAMTWGGNQYDWDSAMILGLLGATLVAVLVLIPVEARVQEPVMPLALFRDRNFNLTTIASLCMGIAMFGAIGYMPTYMQMVLGVSATQAGLLMIPMMGTMLVTSVTMGAVVSKTGRYKMPMIIGSLLIAAGLLMLSKLEVDSSVTQICLALAVVGLGLGLSMQFLTLVVQNSFPITMVGTATASSNFFRQVGATVGSALVGGLFTARLTELLTERMQQAAQQAGGQAGAAAGQGSGGVGVSSLTPEVVDQLPGPLHDIVVGAYNEALTPIFLWIMPLGVIAAVVLMFLVEKELATTVDGAGHTAPVSAGEGSAQKAGHDAAGSAAADGSGDGSGEEWDGAECAGRGDGSGERSGAGERGGRREDEESHPRAGEFPTPDPATLIRPR